MPKPYQLALHIFRRDLRLHDNTALINALKSAEQVIPCFIFDPRQIQKNEYKSDNAIQFMVTSLKELDTALTEKGGRLHYFFGIAEEVIQQLLETTKADAVFVNRDYTPFSIQRDRKIAQTCNTLKRDFHSFADALLHEPEESLKSNNEPYTIFTPFFRKNSQQLVREPASNRLNNYYTGKVANTDQATLTKLSALHQPNILVKGGRTEALSLLKNLVKLKEYKEIRNYPALQATTKLSAHIKFGTLSIREVYAAVINTFGIHHTLISELYWRDFFTQIGMHFPRVYQGAFHEAYNRIDWSHNENHFRAWCNGLTGFPIVDAGMRELQSTGYMHNRVRMITASFLTKDLHINWQLGEKYFANKLTDYDPALNNGNWQWAASTGCDAQPYFRIFNPWLQQKKYDPDCLYIKKWIPELSAVKPAILHNWWKAHDMVVTNYPAPIIDHTIASTAAKAMYKSLKIS